MKRSIIALLTLVICISISITGVQAKFNKETLIEDFYDFCNNKIESTNENDYVFINDYIETDDMIFFTGQCSWIFMHQMIVCADSMGDWHFMSNPCESGLSGLGVYVKLGNDIYSIETAWEENLVTDLTPVSKLKDLAFYHTGDINGDKNLNIKDATALQKYIANKEVEVVSSPNIREKIFDMNKDEKVNIQDATAIQKYLAKM